jgi:hypothetical protein
MLIAVIGTHGTGALGERPRGRCAGSSVRDPPTFATFFPPAVDRQ